MTWIVKGTESGDEYLVEFEHKLYGKLVAKDWCMDQKFAFRWTDRNAAASVARKLGGDFARVVKLTSPLPGDSEGMKR